MELVVNGVTKYGLCDDKMELITPVVFDGMTISSAGQIWVKYQGKWGIIDNPLNDTAEKTWGAYLGKAFTNSSNGTTGPVQSTGSMKDIAGSWCEEYVMDLVDRGIASGYADGTYRPGTPVTRGAIAKMTMLAMQDAGSMIQESTEDDPFPDMAGNWAEVYAVPLAQAGILVPGEYPDGFGAGTAMTRLETAKTLVRVYLYAHEETQLPIDVELAFSDAGKISDTDAPYVSLAVSLGIISGYQDGSFKPEASINRGTAAAMISRFLNTVGKIDDTAN